MTDALAMVVALLAEEPPRDTGPDFGKARPVRPVDRGAAGHRHVLADLVDEPAPEEAAESFEANNPEQDQAADDGTVGRKPDTGPTARVRRVSPAVNALAEATSPYLRQHADNPVHWQQWTPEALAEAASRDVPILLSIGYAACHWCHVMAHESFEDDEVAAAMNAGSCASRWTARNGRTWTRST